jgi:hypothetical protein
MPSSASGAHAVLLGLGDGDDDLEAGAGHTQVVELHAAALDDLGLERHDFGDAVGRVDGLLTNIELGLHHHRDSFSKA